MTRSLEYVWLTANGNNIGPVTQQWVGHLWHRFKPVRRRSLFKLILTYCQLDGNKIRWNLNENITFSREWMPNASVTSHSRAPYGLFPGCSWAVLKKKSHVHSRGRTGPVRRRTNFVSSCGARRVLCFSHIQPRTPYDFYHPYDFLPVRPSEAPVGILRRCCSRGHIRLRAPYDLTRLYTYGLVE